MPELPEVEIARRHLERWLGGGTVVRAFDEALVGKKVTRVDRRGKWLRVSLHGATKSDGVLFFSHLGMTGKWSKREPSAPSVRWELARIDVERRGKAQSVRYSDPRRFGRLEVTREDIESWRALGPDPLLDGIDVARLAERLGRRKLSVKEVLMDQAVLAGVGNIQATEALWRARIDPRTRSDALSTKDVRAIARAIEWSIARTLAEAAMHGDEMGYVSDADGENPFSVYGRKGEPCPRCKAVLVRYDLGGRTTTSCTGCQLRLRVTSRSRQVRVTSRSRQVRVTSR